MARYFHEFLKKVIHRFILIIGRHGLLYSFYFTYWLRPKKSCDINSLFEIDNRDNIVIVLRGRIETKNDFTLETVRLYRRYYPNVPIIVSTWDNVDKSIKKELEIAGAEICLSSCDKPLLNGFGSINLQLRTAKEGVSRAQQYPIDYILVTRTDQRFYEPNIFSFLLKLNSHFPLRLQCNADGRLIAISTSTFINRLYNISDMFIFGSKNDVIRYFSCPYDTRPHGGEVETEDPEEFSKNRCGEIYFTTNYIESLGFNLKWTKEDSDYYRKNLFIIVDSESLDFYWPKYTELEYRWRKYNPFVLTPSSFKEWMSLEE